MLGTLIQEDAVITVSYNTFANEADKKAFEKWQRQEFAAIDVEKERIHERKKVDWRSLFGKIYQ